ncbi:MAG: GtrA family protein [Ruminococcaceae bacterium]|jgi:putative flippase GtrA|nr:GtrA family protein [Oscillospiraceae bacterium]
MIVKKLLRFFFSREMILYVIAGVLTTLVNIIVFTLLSTAIGHDRWWLSNFPAITASILFAFFVNRSFVFRSAGPLWQEFGKFVLSRAVVSLAFEYGGMFLLYDVLGLTTVWPILRWELPVSKLLTMFLVLAGNYVLSKWFIFRKSARERQS